VGADKGLVEGMTNATELLGGGVFVLLHRGEVVFVGKSSGPMLAKIAALRSSDRPRWLPKIAFDEIRIRFVHPDRLADAYFALIAEYSPRHNAPTPASLPPTILARRI